MTDKDIIKALECCIKSSHFGECFDNKCPLVSEKGCEVGKETLYPYVFDLINRQKAEIERLKDRQKPTGASGYKVENGKVVFFTNMLGGCKVVKENLEEVVKTMNELLQECYSKDEIAFALKCKTQELKTAKAEAVKEFAERLKERLVEESYDDVQFFKVVGESEIDNLLKEMIGEEK